MYEQMSIPALYIKIKKNKNNNSEYITALDCFVSFPDNLLDIPDNLDIYLSNLRRLQLLSIDKGKQLTSWQEKYECLINNFKKHADDDKFLKDKHFIFHSEVLEITHFGFAFAQICLEQEK